MNIPTFPTVQVSPGPSRSPPSPDIKGELRVFILNRYNKRLNSSYAYSHHLNPLHCALIVTYKDEFYHVKTPPAPPYLFVTNYLII